jgi:hypothetical protein
MVDTAAATAPMLAKRTKIGVVGDKHRNASIEGSSQHLAEWYRLPTEVRGEMDEPVTTAGDSYDRSAYSDKSVTGREPLQNRCGKLGDVLYGLIRAEVGARASHPYLVENVTANPNGGDSEGVDRYFDSKHDGTMR